MIAIAKLVSSLYILDDSCFSSFSQSLSQALNVHSFPNPCVHSSSLSNKMQDLDLWHHRLGHASTSLLKHVPFLSHLDFHTLSRCSVCPLSK